MSQEIVEFEFHISPACSSSRPPQMGVGTSGTSSSSRRAQSGSSLRRLGLSTASSMSGINPSRQRRTSYRKSARRANAAAPTAPSPTTPRSSSSRPHRRLLDHEPRLGNVDLQRRVVEVAAITIVEPCRKRLEDASVPPNGVAAGAEWQPVQVDARWAELVERHHALVRRHLDRFRGREIDTAGDGFFAAFYGPSRAIRCACAILEAVRELGLQVRAGLHTGECETVGEKIGGIAVNIGARVAAQARPGEVLVSTTVKDLVAGSGIAFSDRGTVELKGVPGESRLFAVTSA